MLARLLRYGQPPHRETRLCTVTTDPFLLPDDDTTAFLVNRLELLHKLLADRRTWQEARATFGAQSTPSVGWIDGDGELHRTPLTRDFLAGHAAVLRTVTNDLMHCGPEGQRLVRVIVGIPPQQSPTDSDDDPGAIG
jgi:hypothetical protein